MTRAAGLPEVDDARVSVQIRKNNQSKDSDPPVLNAQGVIRTRDEQYRRRVSADRYG